MGDRIHPEPTRPAEAAKPVHEDIPGCPPAEETWPSGSFVIQLPRDQIYRIPPPENDYHFKAYTRRAARRRHGSCCRCLAYTAAALAVLILSAAAAAGILFLIFRPKLPTYSIDSVSVRALNLASAALSPEIDVAVRADNPNKKIGIYYRDGSSVAVAFSGDVLCRGVWPTFYQSRRNVTAFHTTLKGSGLRISDGMRRSLTEAVNRRKVPLEIRVEVPVRLRFGAFTSWTVTVKARCDVTVDKLTADSRVVSKSCNVKADVF